MNIRWFVSLAIFLCLTKTALGESLPHYGKNFQGTLPGKPKLHSNHVRRPENLVVLDLVGSALYNLKGDQVVASMAASNVEYENNNQKAFVPLRDNLRDHDGKLLRPETVAIALQGLSKKLGNPLNTAKKIEWNPSRKAIEFDFSWPVANLAKRLSMPEAALWGGVHESLKGRRLGAFLGRSLGNGVTNGAWIFDGNKIHYDGVPFLDQITLVWNTNIGVEAKQFERGYTQMSRFGQKEHAIGKVKYKFKTRNMKDPSTIFLRVKNPTSEREHNAILEALSRILGRKKFNTAGSYGILKTETLFERLKGFSKRRSKRLRGLHQRRKQTKDAIKKIIGERTLLFTYRPSKPIHERLLQKITFLLHQEGVASKMMPDSDDERRSGEGFLVVEMDEWVFDTSSPELLLRQLISAGLSEGKETRPYSLKRLKARYASSLPILPLVDFYPKFVFRSDVEGVNDGCSTCFSSMYFYKRPKFN